jgi:pimeloyl-ACP methyl ester carboxylesterase
MRLFLVPCLALAAFSQTALKLVPPAGIPVLPADREELEAGLARLQAATAKLKGNPLLPDVLIYQEAVRYALQYNEFFKPGEIAAAKTLLKQGEERAAQLASGGSPWAVANGLVVRGYVSKIDRSVQPYGLVVPADFKPDHNYRLDLWFHGRNETLSEVNFLTDRQKNPGEFQPKDAIVLHLYGRFCNANRFAGEVDLFEALEAAKREYPIDENRILVRGFSMGGASTWQFGAHYPGLWAAVAPGAGFTETKEFLHLKEMPPEWEQKLWHLYDAADYAANFYNVPVIEYHGEIDPQKQAGDVMQKAMAAVGLELDRIEGPQTPHRYHPDAKIELEDMLTPIVRKGNDPHPKNIHFTTWTLAYNNIKWLTVDALEHHWERAKIDADDKITSRKVVETPTGKGEVVGHTVFITTSNVAAFSVARTGPFTVDGQRFTTGAPIHFRKVSGKWTVASSSHLPGLHKVHGLQGPIDDAFMSSFLIVSPTGTPAAPGTAQWVQSEEEHAITEWRRQFRGEAQVRDDKAITDADIANNNLILFGDPGSNKILARIADKLPMKWPTEASQALIMIYPNPLNPAKYVVLNSGFTFREFDYLNNARQSPKLPDYAIVDTTVKPDAHYPGKIVSAGFFNEDWKQ